MSSIWSGARVICLLFSMYTISPELAAISGDAKPPVNPISDRTVFCAVSTVPEAVEVPPTTALAASEANANTTPASVCVVGDWKYFKIPLVESQETTVALAVPPVTVCVIVSSAT